ncbi:MAG: rhodanese-like domain-containing protein [Planctomycetota bacterium]|nr:rhodanese-like domain-containing protein [Planctomycetota bacterium]
MSFETITPPIARERLDQDSWTYLDVRTVEEYDAGHVPGAFNVPLLHHGPMGMEPNPEFVQVVEKHFAKDQRLVVGCKIGGRSARACDLLAGVGWSNLANMDGGFSGRHDEIGRLVQEGWVGSGFPHSIDPEAGRTYAELSGQ